MSELRINNITDRAGSSGPIIAGVSTVTSTSHMVMPSGPTEMRGGRGRGIFAGGYEVPAVTSEIQTIEIATTGNGTRFGDLSNLISSLIIYLCVYLCDDRLSVFIMRIQLLICLLVLNIVICLL